MRASVLAVVLAACGGTGVIEGPDAGPDAIERAYTLAFAGTPGSSIYLQVRDGGGPWQAVGLDAAGHGEVRITSGFHSYVSGCRTLGLRIRQLLAGYGAGAPAAPIALPCGEPVVRVTVTGTITPPDGKIEIETALVSGSGPTGQFQMTPHAGTYDILATDAAVTRALVRRGLDLTADTTLALDVTADGFDLASAPLTVTGATTDSLTAYSELHGGPGALLGLPTGPDVVRYVPADQRAPGERVDAYVIATTPDGSRARTVQHRFAGDGTLPEFAMPAYPSMVVDRGGARWTGDWDVATMGVFSADPGRFVSMTIDRAWVLGTGAGQVAWIDPATLPDWDPLDVILIPGQNVSWNLFLSSGELDGEAVSASASGNLRW